MIFIVNHSHDAYYNMAVEEYFLDCHDDDVFLLWQNKNAIVVGKNQNTLAEIDFEFCKENRIDVVRRLTGGGAMYQDLGNLNFTFIKKGREWFSDFSYFIEPILDALHEYGVNATLSGRNDIEVEGRKISGNAQTVRGDKILHHGTLLINSDLSVLGRALRPDPEKIAAKGVSSVTSRVANVCEFSDIDVNAFVDTVCQKVCKRYPDTKMYNISAMEQEKIMKLADEKYRTWEWNFGSSPNYTFKNKARFASGTVQISLSVLRGKISDIVIEGDFFGMCDVSDIQTALCGVKHHECAIREVLSRFKIEDYFMGISEADILSLLLP